MGEANVTENIETQNLNTEIKENKNMEEFVKAEDFNSCLLYTSPSPRDATLSRMPSSA